MYRSVLTKVRDPPQGNVPIEERLFPDPLQCVHRIHVFTLDVRELPLAVEPPPAVLTQHVETLVRKPRHRHRQELTVILQQAEHCWNSRCC